MTHNADDKPFGLAGVVYGIDVLRVFPDLLRREKGQYHEMLESLEQELKELPALYEMESRVGTHGQYVVTLKCYPEQAEKAIWKAVGRVHSKWARRKAKYDTKGEQSND